jgi:exosortase K
MTGSRNMKIKLATLAVVVLVVWALKRYYSDAHVDDLWWILRPAAWLTTLVTGVTFAWSPGEGYISRDRLFLVEKSCAGINFMIAAFGMVSYSMVHRARSAASAAAVIAASLLAGYLDAVIVNTTRIVVALWLATQSMTVAGLSAADVHRLEGISIYFGGLVVLYEIVRRVDRRTVVA